MSILIINLILSFFVTLFFTKIWIRKAKKVGLVGRDVHKLSQKEVAEAGGVSVLFGFLVGILSYLAIKTFYFKDMNNFIEIISMLNVILIISLIGLVDDILGWKIGLTKKTRILFLIFAAVPLMVINAGESSMMGVELGLIYPLFFIPLGIVGASTTFNFVAGYNGLEAGQGVLILTGLGIVTFFTGEVWLSLICFIMVSCLVAFYLFNKYPAQVFPGDILTYSLGALIACIAILGDIEKIAVFFFIPYIIEVGLKVRGRLKKESFLKLNKDETLELPYEKFYSLGHIAVYLLKKIKKSKKVSEKEVVYLIWGFETFIVLIGLFIFKRGIFI